MKEIIIVKKASDPGAFGIGTKFVLASNWEFSKPRFSLEEQKEFENKILNSDQELQ